MEAEVQRLYETCISIDVRQTGGRISLQTAEEELFDEIDVALNRGIITEDEAQSLRGEWSDHRRRLSEGVNRESAHLSFTRAWNECLTHAVA